MMRTIVHLPVTRSTRKTRITMRTMMRMMKRITTGLIRGIRKRKMKKNMADAVTTAAGMKTRIADIRTEAVQDVSPTATGDMPALPVEGVLRVWTRNAAGRSPAGVVNIPMKEGLLPAAGVPVLPAAGAVVVPAEAVPATADAAVIPVKAATAAVSSPAAADAAVMAAVPAVVLADVPQAAAVLPAVEIPVKAEIPVVTSPAVDALAPADVPPVADVLPAAAVGAAAVPGAGKQNDSFHKNKQIGPVKTLFVCLINIY